MGRGRLGGDNGEREMARRATGRGRSERGNRK